jgi:hypothetical protein
MSLVRGTVGRHLRAVVVNCLAVHDTPLQAYFYALIREQPGQDVVHQYGLGKESYFPAIFARTQ